jgi:asparagine synthase (glutamine-hydrolysing)
MCGIAGFIDLNRRIKDPLHVLEEMQGCMVYRGPDDSGEWFDQSTGTGFAFRRLSIIDLSPTGHQPMVSQSGRYTIVFNGEVYNHVEISARLSALGHSFRGHSDTEVMLAAFEQWGIPKSVQMFVGMFAFAVHDRDSRNVTLCRDRMGIKPLYWGWIDEGDRRLFAFASELQCLRPLTKHRPAVNLEAIASYLRFLYVPSPLSAFHGVCKLKPGHLLEVNEQGDVREYAFWDAKEIAERASANPFRGTLQEASDQLNVLLRDAVGLRMIADVPVGAFLSGGIDSSLVVSIMQSLSRQPVRTFTISFDDERFNEGEHARRVAEHLGTVHVDQRIRGEDLQALLPRLPAMFDEPFADSSAIPTYLVSALARKEVKVSLSGDGGDELFGGYHRYISASRYWEVCKFPMLASASQFAARTVPDVAFNGIAATLARINPRFRESLGSEKLKKFLRAARSSSADELYRWFVSTSTDPVALMVQGSTEPPLRFPGIRNIPDLGNVCKELMWIDTRTYLPDDLLCKVDRASMAVSLEARVPLIDHRVAEWAWGLPQAYLYDGYKGKLLLRKLLASYVPPTLTERPKMGFGVPLAKWLRGPLKEWAGDLLAPDLVQRLGVLDPQATTKCWQQFLNNPGANPNRIWSLVMLQGWLANSRSAYSQ